MPISYNAGEILEIAAQIEKNGKEFYTLAHQKTTDPDARALLKELAVWEDEHAAIFDCLLKNVIARTGVEPGFDVDDDTWEYMKAAADSHIFVANANLPRLLDTCTTAREVLEMALRFEKDSVVFYATVRKIVPEGEDRDAVGRVEEEEMRHVAIIQRQLKLFSE